MFKLPALVFTLPLLVSAQLIDAPHMRPPEEPNPKTLIPQSVIENLAAEVSGSLGLAHILEIAGYERDRPAEEYKTVYREAAYVEKMARQYNLEDVHIERFPLAQKQWDGELGELWLLKPQKRLIVNYRDIAASLATGSQTADVTAEVIYCGRGDKKSDYVEKNVAGKIVLVSGAPGAAANLAVREFGALGILSFANATGRPVERPEQIAWNGLGRGFSLDGGRGVFAFNLSRRMGTELVEALEKGEKLTVRARVKAAEYDTEMQVPTAVIKGDGTSEQEIVLAAHLFEGVAKQGSMDNASGSAVVLEIARAWKKLIDEGTLPRPRRTVRFLWVPEISGTNAYLRRFPDEVKRMIAAMSIDMAGEDPRSRNSLRLMRTPYSLGHFINDVPQQFFEYVGDTNREKVQNRRLAYSYMFPIVDPQGSRNQFYYNIEKHYGASDHVVFMGQGVPAVLVNNWPDYAYHTNEDRAYNADPTELKRAAFIGLASCLVMASADGPGAIRVAGMIMGHAAERSARDLGAALQPLGEGGALREALARVLAAYERETNAIRSAAVLAEGDKAAAAAIEDMASTFSSTGLAADVARVRAYAKSRSVTEEPLPAAEAEAAKLIPVRLKPDPQGFGGGGGGGGGGGPQQPEAPRLTGLGAQEARAFADGKRTILDIRDRVSAEFGAMDVNLFLDYFKNLEKSGTFQLKQR